MSGMLRWSPPRWINQLIEVLKTMPVDTITVRSVVDNAQESMQCRAGSVGVVEWTHWSLHCHLMNVASLSPRTVVVESRKVNFRCSLEETWCSAQPISELRSLLMPYEETVGCCCLLFSPARQSQSTRCLKCRRWLLSSTAVAGRWVNKRTTFSTALL